MYLVCDDIEQLPSIPSHQQKVACLPATAGKESPILLDRSAFEVTETILAGTEKLMAPPAAGTPRVLLPESSAKL